MPSLRLFFVQSSGEKEMAVRKGWNAALGIALLLASSAAFAGSAAAVRRQIESSMLLTGEIQVDAEGRVTGHSLDDAGKVPPGVVSLIDKAVPSWTFEPMRFDGKPVRVSTDMSIRVVARKLEQGDYEVAIRSAAFGGRSRDPKESIQAVSMPAPDYPLNAWRAGVVGTVYLLVRAGRDGKVIDAIAEQTNLRVAVDEHAMARWRRVLEDVSTRQAQQWKFTPPTQGEDANRDFWVARVPVVFNLDRPHDAPTYGHWETYVPGPRQRDPWDTDGDEGIGFSPDTLAPGRAYLTGSGLKLLTALSGT